MAAKWQWLLLILANCAMSSGMGSLHPSLHDTEYVPSCHEHCMTAVVTALWDVTVYAAA